MTTQDPDEIRDGIEQTQRDLSANVDALTSKLSPQRIVHDKVQQARTAMVSMKERVTGGAVQKTSANGGTAVPAAAAGGTVSAATGTVSSAKSTVSSATSSAVKTAGTVTAVARRGILAQPVAAVLIAFGAGWLIGALLPSPGRSSGRRPR